MLPTTLARIIFRQRALYLALCTWTSNQGSTIDSATEYKDQSTKHGSATTHMIIRINYPYNGAISRRVFAPKRKAGFLSPAPENQFADACAGGVDRHQGFALWLQTLIEGLND